MPLASWAQVKPALPRIGVLDFGKAPADMTQRGYKGFLAGLRDLGYVEGTNLAIEWRYGEGRPDRLRMLAMELEQLNVAMIVAGGPPVITATRAAAQRTPILAVGGADPVGEGWAKSLARPGGNLTGLTVTFPELGAKRLEILKEAVPTMARAAVLFAPAELDAEIEKDAMHQGARSIGLELQWLEVRTPADIEPAFARAAQGRAQGLCALATNLIAANGRRIAELAQHQRLPTIGDFAFLARAGFLMTYGADLDALFRRSATYVDKILKGARPGDLPIERPSQMELVLNLTVAKAIGIKLPEDLVQRADHLIVANGVSR